MTKSGKETIKNQLEYFLKSLAKNPHWRYDHVHRWIPLLKRVEIICNHLQHMP